MSLSLLFLLALYCAREPEIEREMKPTMKKTKTGSRLTFLWKWLESRACAFGKKEKGEKMVVVVDVSLLISSWVPRLSPALLLLLSSPF